MKELSTDRLLSIGMALTADKKTMERRVRGIFAKQKSAKPAKLLALALCFALGAACFTTACIPIVSSGNAEEVVWYVDENGKVQADWSSAAPYEKTILGAEAEASALQLPARVEKEISGLPDNMSASVDAEVVGLDQTTYPVYVVQRGQFTQESFEQTLDVLTDGAELFEPRESDGTSGYTKNELETAISHYRAALSQPGADTDHLQVMIDDLEAELQSASENRQGEPKTILAEHSASVSKSSAEYFDAEGKRMLLQVCFGAEDSTEGDTLAISPAGIGGYLPDAAPVDEATAQQSALDLLQKLGIDANCIRTDVWGDDAYRFVFAHRYPGMPGVRYDNVNLYNLTNSALCDGEQIRIQMDGDGLYELYWEDREELIGYANKNVPLLPFDQIYEAFEQEARDRELWRIQMEGAFSFPISEYRFTVTRFALDYAYVTCSVDSTLRYIIPVWRVFGELSLTVPETATGEDLPTLDENNAFDAMRVLNGSKERAILTINAIDGSIVYD